MGFPANKTNAVDGPPGIGTPIVASLLNNLEDKVGIDSDTNPNSLDYKVNQKSKLEYVPEYKAFLVK